MDWWVWPILMLCLALGWQSVLIADLRLRITRLENPNSNDWRLKPTPNDRLWS